LTKESIAKPALPTTRKIIQAIENTSSKSLSSGSTVVDKQSYSSSTVMEDASDRDTQLAIPTTTATKNNSSNNGSNTSINQENANPFALNNSINKVGNKDVFNSSSRSVIKNRITPKVTTSSTSTTNNYSSKDNDKVAELGTAKRSSKLSISTSDNNDKESVIVNRPSSRPSSLTISTSQNPIPRLDLNSPAPKIYFPIDDLLEELLAHPPDSPSSQAKLKTFRNSISEPSCPKCYGTVARADEVSVYGVTWHRRCFCCTDCDVLLRSDNFVEDNALLFCKSCHSDKASIEGINGSTSTSVSSMSGQPKRASISNSGIAGSSQLSQSIRASGNRQVHQLQMITEETNQESTYLASTPTDQQAATTTATALASVMGSPMAMPYRVTKSFEKLSLESPSHGASTATEIRDRHSLSLAGYNRSVRRFSLASNANNVSTPTKRGSISTTPNRTSITSYNASTLIGISPRASITASSPIVPPKILSARAQSPRKTGADFDFTFEDKEKTAFQYHLDSVVEDIEKERVQEREYALLLSDLVTFTDISFNDVVYRGIHFTHSFDFDEKGVFYWLGSSGKTSFYRNPHTSGRITASMSSCYAGDPFNIVARSADHCPNYTYNRAESWVEIDFGPQRLMLVDKYTVRHGSSTVGNALRSWKLQAKVGSNAGSKLSSSASNVLLLESSNNNSIVDYMLSGTTGDSSEASHSDDNNNSYHEWVTLKEHEDDQTLSEDPNSTATWDVEIPGSIASDLNSLGFRYFRILQTDLNSSGNNCLFCCGLEFYGLLFEKVDSSNSNNNNQEGEN